MLTGGNSCLMIAVAKFNHSTGIVIKYPKEFPSGGNLDIVNERSPCAAVVINRYFFISDDF